MLRVGMDDEQLLDRLKKKLGENVSTEKALLLQGSETGNAEYMAGVLATELLRRGVKTNVMSMDDQDFDDLPNEKMVQSVIATCGQGEYPGNCKLFMEALADPNLPSDHLKDVKYAIFSMGDSSYAHFNKAGKDLEANLQRLGASQVLDAGMADDKDEEGYETAWNEWAPDVFTANNLPPPPEELMPPKQTVNILDSSAKCDSTTTAPLGSLLRPLNKNELLTPENQGRDVRHQNVDISGTGWEYEVGDCLGVYPHNSQEDVLAWMERAKIDSQQVLDIVPVQGSKNLCRTPIKAEQFFTECADVFGRPSRRFQEFLSINAKDEKEKAELKHLLSKEGNAELKEMANKEYVTYADLLARQPSAMPEMDYLVDNVPLIKPRLYSIASANRMVGDNVELAIIQDDWYNDKNEYRHGLTTHFLRHDGANKHISCNLNAGGVTIPEGQDKPQVMVGLGTGIAPMRAMVQDRAQGKSQGEECGPMALFFGNRHYKTEFLQGEELEGYERDGLLSMHNAWSRDQENKIQVHHRMQENMDLLQDQLVKQEGQQYLCGPAGDAVKDCRKILVETLIQKGGYKPEDADNYVTQMHIDGRYNLDTW